MIIRRLLVLALLFVAAPLGACCVWDRDSLADELKGEDALLDAIAGGVDRFPVQFYEMRLARLERKLEENPEDLAAHDECFFALLRCGRVSSLDAALHAKRASLSKLGSDAPDAREHRYRLQLNAAFAAVVDAIESDDRQKARVAARAIELAVAERAPTGGDRYLKLFVDWLLKPEAAGDSLLPDFLGLRHANKTALAANSQLKDRGLDDCIEGLSALIRAAPQFENVDIYYVLSLALAAEGRQSLSHLARLRCYEIIEAGGRSLAPGAPRGDQLKLQVTPRKPEAGRMVDMIPLSNEMRAAIEKDYAALRVWARGRNESRHEYLVGRLRLGQHPDTLPDFWSGWSEPARPELAAAPVASPSDPPKIRPAPSDPAPKHPVAGGLPAPATPEPGRIAVGGLHIHWAGIAVAAVLLMVVGLVAGLALTRRRTQDTPPA